MKVKCDVCGREYKLRNSSVARRLCPDCERKRQRDVERVKRRVQVHIHYDKYEDYKYSSVCRQCSYCDAYKTGKCDGLLEYSKYDCPERYGRK